MYGTAEKNWRLSDWPRYPESLRYRAKCWALHYPQCRGYLRSLQYRRYPRHPDYLQTLRYRGCHQPSYLPPRQSQGCPLGQSRQNCQYRLGP